MASPPPDPLERGMAVGVITAAVLLVFVHAAFIGRDVVDDAGISLGYAMSIAEGHGLRLTPNSAAVEGFSNPLWTLVLVAGELLRLPGYLFAQRLGIALGALSLPVFAAWGPAAAGRRLRLEDGLGPVLACADPTFVYWIGGGLETGLQTLCLAASGLALFTLRSPRSAVACGLAFASVALGRPEGGMFAVAGALVYVGRLAFERRLPRRPEAIAVVTAAVTVAVYMLVRWVAFAELLPNTYFAKVSWDFGSRTYLESYGDAHRALLTVGAAAFALALVGGRGTLLPGLLVALYVGLQIAFTAKVKGDWMKEWRFLAFLSPLVATAVPLGISALRRGAGALLEVFGLVPLLPGRWWRGGRLTLLGALCLAPVVRVVPEALARSAAVKQIGSDVPFKSVRGDRSLVEERARAVGMRRPLVAATDMGYVGVAMREAEAIDLVGLTDYAIAHHAGNVAAQEDYLVSEGLPTFVMAWGPAEWFWGRPRLAPNYERPDHVAVLKGVTATEDPRCPGGKGAVLALRARELLDAIAADLRGGDPVRALATWRCAYAYRDGAELPALSDRRALAREADARGTEAAAHREIERAVRYFSLATHLDDRDPRRRRKTEQYRALLFPLPPKT